VLVPGKPFQRIWVRQGAYTRVENLKGALLRLVQALHAIIRLTWKGSPETNTLAYNKQKALINYGYKSFINCAQQLGATFTTIHYVCNLHLGPTN
jgi:hypothetical protein